MTAVGMEGLFFIVSASYVLTVLTLMLMDDRLHQVSSEPDASSSSRSNDSDSAVVTEPSSVRLTTKVKARVRDMVEGIKYVRQESAIASIIGYGILIGVVATPMETLMPVVTEEVYFGDSATYGRLLLAVGIGGLIGTFTVTLIGTRSKPPLYMAIGGVSVGACYIVFGAVDVFLFALIIVGAIGGLSVVKGTMSTTVVQTVTSDTFRGRVMSLMNFTWGAQAVGALMMGTLAELWGAPFAFVVAGVTAIIATLGVWQFALRRLT